MSAELDMSQYLGLFMQEAEEQLEILETETLKLETDASQERLQVIFRAAHTLKGSSRAMGFSKFAELTHELENILDLLRAGKLSLSSSITDRLLAAIDALGQMAASIGAGEGDNLECGPLVRSLQECAGEAGSAAPAAATVKAPDELPDEIVEALTAALEQGPIFDAKFRLMEDCVMKFARAFMAINAIQASGEILVAIPETEKLEEEEFEQDFRLIFHYSGDTEALEKELKSLGEMESVALTSWEPTAPGASAAEAVSAPADVAAPVASVPDAAPPRKAETAQTVRVDVARLDSLMNLVGELAIDRTRISQVASELASATDDPRLEILTEVVGHVARITTDLQDQIMKARMMPVEIIFNRLPRVVRDLAQKLGKDIKLELHGAETELDRTVIELIGDPILHVLRNSLDHGLETPADRLQAGKPEQGSLIISAAHQENHIVIQIQDDGRGIDPARIRAKAVEKGMMTEAAAERLTDKEAVQLVFASGFSTAQEVSEVSGRGVGMDIVRSNIQKVGGMIDIDSVAGKGTTVSLRLPLTLAIIRGLMIRQTGQVYVIPLASVIETLAIHDESLQTVNGREVIVIRGQTIPILRLERALGVPPQSAENSSRGYAVIVGIGEQRLGLAVDGLVGEQEVVIKSISRFCGGLGSFNGATILGDGRVALILDIAGLAMNSRGL
jgi:two-component system chemotaxis sensor kinase CheA